jgi:hypothetical protein
MSESIGVLEARVRLAIRRGSNTENFILAEAPPYAVRQIWLNADAALSEILIRFAEVEKERDSATQAAQTHATAAAYQAARAEAAEAVRDYWKEKYERSEMFKRARSSITGRFVTLWYALRHKKTTTIETVNKKEGS